MVNTILRRTVFVSLAIALIAGLAAPSAGAASAAGKPSKHAEKSGSKKKKKKSKKRKRSEDAKLWYRFSITGTGTVISSSPEGRATVTRSNWKSASRTAAILYRRPALRPPDAGPGPLVEEHHIVAGISGTVTDGSRLSTAPDVFPECPGAFSQRVVQTTPGLVEGKADGTFGSGTGTLRLQLRTAGGEAVDHVESECYAPSPPQPARGPGVIECPPDAPWQVSGSVKWKKPFQLSAKCLHEQTSIWGLRTVADAVLTRDFKPCPGGGARVKDC